jgi:hypothetical protein
MVAATVDVAISVSFVILLVFVGILFLLVTMPLVDRQLEHPEDLFVEKVHVARGAHGHIGEVIDELERRHNLG